MRASTSARAHTQHTVTQTMGGWREGSTNPFNLGRKRGALLLWLGNKLTKTHCTLEFMQTPSPGKANKNGCACEPYWLASLGNRGCWFVGVVVSSVIWPEVSTSPEQSQGSLYWAKRGAMGCFAHRGPTLAPGRELLRVGKKRVSPLKLGRHRPPSEPGGPPAVPGPLRADASSSLFPNLLSVQWRGM